MERGRAFGSPKALALALALWALCAPGTSAQADEPPAPLQAGTGESWRARVVAVGDIMVHDSMLQAAGTPTGHDFAPFFAHVAPLLSAADLAVGNLETVLAGREREFTGYPNFNSPDSLADAIAGAGFDVITTSNNHSLDRGFSGLERTLEQLERVGLRFTGTFRTEEERKSTLVVRVNGVRLGFVAYTYSTNGGYKPRKRDFALTFLKEREAIAQDIARLREVGVDAIIAAVHFGEEYATEPDARHRSAVKALAALGVDVVLGHHPHVVQPVEILRLADADGKEREVLVAWSLGNFISGQRTQPRDLGGILDFTVVRTPTGTRIENVTFEPTYVHRYWAPKGRPFEVIALSQLEGGQMFTGLAEPQAKALVRRLQALRRHAGLEQPKSLALGAHEAPAPEQATQNQDLARPVNHLH